MKIYEWGLLWRCSGFNTHAACEKYRWQQPRVQVEARRSVAASTSSIATAWWLVYWWHKWYWHQWSVCGVAAILCWVFYMLSFTSVVL